MKSKLILSIFIVCCIYFTTGATNLVVAAEIERYSKKDAQIKQLCEAVEHPSATSKNVQSEIIGRWTYIPELSDSLPNIIWQFLVFRNGGIVEYSYELKNKKIIVNKSEVYEVIHKASANKYPGKAPNVIITSKGPKDESVILFIGVTVNYDSRVSIEMGKVLKFTDMNGAQYCFLEEK